MDSPFHTGIQNQIYYEHFRGRSNSSEAILFLHGYPADQGTRNRDLAAPVEIETGADVYIIHYPGLGNSPGQFTFSRSLQASQVFYDFLVNTGRYTTVHLFGHSWGGFIALNLVKEKAHVGTVTVASPFLRIPKDQELETLVNAVFDETKKYLTHTNTLEIQNDLNAISTWTNFETNVDFLNATGKSINLIQAIEDDETPVEIAREFRSALKNINYKEIHTNHSFENSRDEVSKFIVSSIKK
ncbi:MAG: alpha/beta fold hydrolase [Bdellovibrio sp.]